MLATIALAALGTSAATASGPPTPADLGRVLNQNFAVDGAVEYRAAPTAAAAHRKLRADLAHAPRWLRGHIRLSPVLDDRFTLTTFGDQACLAWSAGQVSAQVRPSACTPGQRRVSLTPLTDSATRLAMLTSWLRHTVGVHASLDTDDLGELAGMAAPAGVTILGVSDVDHSGYDDDGRVTFAANGKAVCAQLPLTVAGHWRMYYADCRTLPRRNVDAFDQQTSRAALQASAQQLAVALAAVSAQADVAVVDLSRSEVRTVLHTLTAVDRQLRIVRPAAGTFTLRRAGCSATVTFAGHSPGTAGQVSALTCH